MDPIYNWRLYGDCAEIHFPYLFPFSYTVNMYSVHWFVTFTFSILKENLEALDTNNDGEISLKEFAGQNNFYLMN